VSAEPGTTRRSGERYGPPERRQRAGLSAEQLREKEAKRRAKAKARREAQSAALRKAAAERKAERAARDEADNGR
jgi:hypothetical protein